MQKERASTCRSPEGLCREQEALCERLRGGGGTEGGAGGGIGRRDVEQRTAEELSEAANDAGTAVFLMLQLGNSYH